MRHRNVGDRILEPQRLLELTLLVDVVELRPLLGAVVAGPIRQRRVGQRGRERPPSRGGTCRPSRDSSCSSRSCSTRSPPASPATMPMREIVVVEHRAAAGVLRRARSRCPAPSAAGGLPRCAIAPENMPMPPGDGLRRIAHRRARREAARVDRIDRHVRLAPPRSPSRAAAPGCRRRSAAGRCRSRRASSAPAAAPDPSPSSAAPPAGGRS